MMRRTIHRLGENQLLIAYGSQTGTSEAFARMLGPFAIKHKFDPVICSLDDAVWHLQSNDKPAAMLCVCSTYGTGEFPSNAQRFADALSHGQLSKLEGVPYSVLGLGNSHNELFNAAAKAIDRGLKTTGATPLVRTQLSCEVQGHETAYRTWKSAIWKALRVDDASDAAVPLTYKTSEVLVEAPRELVPQGFARASVRRNDLVTPEGHTPEARHLTFTLPALEQIRRLSGRTATFMDNVYIMPSNSDDLVARAVKRLGLKDTKRTVVEITPLAGSTQAYFNHRKMTIDTLLHRVVDLSAIPSRSLLEVMSCVAEDPAERTHLEDLANDMTSGSEYDRLTHGVFSVVDALEMFPSCKVNLDFLLSHAPHLQARAYSIARDNADWKNDEFEIVYSVPSRADPNNADHKHEGVTTAMLSKLAVNDDLFVRFEPSITRVLPNNYEPLVIVALGTGIGAARAMLQRRRIAKRAGANVGPCIVYYGFRHKGKEEFFREDFAKFEEEGLCEVRRVASHDGDSFTTPMDIMDARVADFLGNRGEFFYCGMGGSVPHLVEAKLRQCKVDVATMRTTGRYHEEYFTTDLDTENLLREAKAENAAATLAGRMGDCSMFCMQCEQTFRGTGCRTSGVCGKTPTVAALQDLVVHQVKVLGFYLSQLRAAGAPEDVLANRLTLYALFSTLTNVNFDEARFVDILKQLRDAEARVEASFGINQLAVPSLPRGTPTFHLGATTDAMPGVQKLAAMGKAVGVLTRFEDPKSQSAAAVAEMLTYGLKGLAAYTDHSLMNNRELPEIYEYMHRALAFLLDPSRWANLEQGLALCLECGKVNVSAMGLLYESNSSLGVPSPHTVPVKPKPGKAILVSGHDLIMMESVLAEAAKHNINVYTHGEMLPSHSYPKLRESPALAGHYGGAWMRQSLEFPHFPGAILMTTNCLTEPHESYRDEIFTAGAVGWDGVPHLGNDMSSLRLQPLIDAALQADGFAENCTDFTYPDPVGQKRPASLTVGFGHETILGAAPTILEEIKKGNITRFFLVGGCDGFEGQRSYYTDLVKNMPETGVVLTLGCGKFRVNHLAEQLGTIGDTGIPRVLDMGQCNDSFSAVQVALALAQALDCKVSDLPLTIVLSWFEQKAVAVLLSCLHLGLSPLHVGPTLPAFVTPEVLQVLVDKFGVKPTGNAIEDLKEMTAAAGAS